MTLVLENYPFSERVLLPKADCPTVTQWYVNSAVNNLMLLHYTVIQQLNYPIYNGAKASHILRNIPHY